MSDLTRHSRARHCDANPRRTDTCAVRRIWSAGIVSAHARPADIASHRLASLYGLSGTDTLDGGTGRDYLEGGTSNDTLAGGAGDDMLSGGRDNDVLRGGTGDDVIASAFDPPLSLPRGEPDTRFCIGVIGSTDVAPQPGGAYAHLTSAVAKQRILCTDQ
jgi:hypothetical protein